MCARVSDGRCLARTASPQTRRRARGPSRRPSDTSCSDSWPPTTSRWSTSRICITCPKTPKRISRCWSFRSSSTVCRCWGYVFEGVPFFFVVLLRRGVQMVYICVFVAEVWSACALFWNCTFPFRKSERRDWASAAYIYRKSERSVMFFLWDFLIVFCSFGYSGE